MASSVRFSANVGLTSMGVSAFANVNGGFNIGGARVNWSVSAGISTYIGTQGNGPHGAHGPWGVGFPGVGHGGIDGEGNFPGQTCLEQVGLRKRHATLKHNEYGYHNAYGPWHPNALSNGDSRGMGTGHGGHWYIPPIEDETGLNWKYDHINSPIYYDNFDTYHGGNCQSVDGVPWISFSGRVGNTRLNQYSKYYEYRGPESWAKQYTEDTMYKASEGAQDPQYYYDKYRQSENGNSNRSFTFNFGL